MTLLRNVSSTDENVTLVQGVYSYHHYMQDNFDDNVSLSRSGRGQSLPFTVRVLAGVSFSLSRTKKVRDTIEFDSAWQERELPEWNQMKKVTSYSHGF